MPEVWNATRGAVAGKHQFWMDYIGSFPWPPHRPQGALKSSCTWGLKRHGALSRNCIKRVFVHLCPFYPISLSIRSWEVNHQYQVSGDSIQQCRTTNKTSLCGTCWNQRFPSVVGTTTIMIQPKFATTKGRLFFDIRNVTKHTKRIHIPPHISLDVENPVIKNKAFLAQKRNRMWDRIKPDHYELYSEQFPNPFYPTLFAGGMVAQW